MRVQRDFVDARHVRGRCRTEYSRAADSDRERRHATGEREDNVLGSELPQQPASPTAECTSHRELLLTRGAAREEQGRDVRARDEQHQRGRAKQQPQRELQSCAGDGVEHRHHGRAEAREIRDVSRVNRR